MRLISSLLLLACVVLSAYAQSSSPCYAKITAVKRTDQYASWTIGSTSYQIYDLTIINEGSCTLTRIVALFSGGQGFLSEAWNYDIPSGLISGYGASLAPGQSFYGAGFVLANSTQPTLALTRPGCDDSCSATTAAPTTAAPTTAAPTTAAPTTAAPTTAAPTTAAPTTAAPTTAAPTQGGCQVTPVVTRDEYSWTDSDSGKNASVYRLTITNAGPCALKDYALSFGYYPGSLLSYWNLEPTRGGFLVKGYGATLAPGASYSAAGMILAGAPDHVAANAYGANCAC